MRVVCLVHFYPPFRNAGSETMLHSLMVALLDHGHEPHVVITDCPEAPAVYELNGVRVYSENTVTGPQRVRELSPDAVVTHHQNTIRAMKVARKVGVPWVFLMHNDHTDTGKTLKYRPDLVVFNTDWIREKYSNYRHKSAVVHPPVWASQHATDPGDRVTLVNLSRNKGSDIFYHLARRFPDQGFLGVIGGHGEQVRRDLPNVEIVEHTTDMKHDVWARTRVLLVPSVYESYGMVGVEAMASGIPVIAAPTPGLQESLRGAGTFVGLKPTDWESALKDVLGSWSEKSALAKARSEELDPSGELDGWVDTLQELCNET